MATVKKGTLTPSPQWWDHLRDWKRVFWKSERKAQYDMALQILEEDKELLVSLDDVRPQPVRKKPKKPYLIEYRYKDLPKDSFLRWLSDGEWRVMARYKTKKACEQGLKDNKKNQTLTFQVITEWRMRRDGK